MQYHGRYVVRSGDEIIAEKNNVITANGFAAINMFLAGSLRNWAGTLAIGSLANTAASYTDSALNYEFARYNVNMRGYAPSATYNSSSVSQLVLKATLEPFDQFVCYEIGVFPPKINLNNYSNNYQITDFSEGSSGTSSWVYASGSTASVSNVARIGASAVSMHVSSSILSSDTVILNGMSFDTSYFSSNDSVNILFYSPVSASVPSGSWTVTFADSSSAYYGTAPQYWTGSGTTASLAANTACFANIQLQNFTSPSAWATPITSMSVTFVPSTDGPTLYLDHAKFVHNLYPTINNTIVSRSSASGPLAGPIFTKYYAQPMEIEYYIDVTS